MVGSRLKYRKRQAFITFAVFFFVLMADDSPIAAQPVTPFFTFNQSPIIQVHGLPALESAAVLAEGRSRYRLVNDLASNYTTKQRNTESVTFDGETNRTTFTYAQGLDQGFEWGLQIPYVNHDPGNLDTFIEDWHDFFQLPQGGRDIAARNRLRYQYQDNGITQLQLTERAEGVGDVRLTGAWQWLDASKATQLAVRAALSLPTGDSDKLQGNGSVDTALWVSADHKDTWLGFPGGVYGGGGVLLMGDGDVLPDQQRRAALFGSVGIGARVFPKMTLKLQTDFHSPLYKNSQLDQINATAVQFIMGGDLQLSEHMQLDLAVGEDLTVKASPDVVFHIGLTVVD